MQLRITSRQRTRKSSFFRPLRLEWLERRDQPDAALGALLVQTRASVTVAGDPFAALASADRPVAVATDIPGLVRVAGTPEQLDRWAALYRDDPFVSFAEPERTLSVEAVPNDPRYLDGTTYGLSGTNGIKAPAAWDVTTGSTAVVVAGIDTGVDYNHPDLYLNIWVNQAEIPADRRANLLDTDGDGRFTFWDLNDARNQGVGKITDINADGRIDGGDLLAPWRADGTGGWADGASADGYVDDLVGWNFITNTNNPMDDHGHGTHTGGTILASGNDGRGVAGVNWRGQLMALKFLAASGSGSDFNAAQAVRYAADHGARVSNNSYSSSSSSTTFSNAIQYAGTLGHVFVAAAGNDGRNTDSVPSYPASYNLANVVSVAATDASGALAGWSNYGAASVDVGAPGVNVYSTTPGGGYGYMSGTSMASPHVAGVAALVIAAHPGWTNTQVIGSILGTTTPAAALAGRSVSGGIVNAAGAIGPPVVPPPASGSASFLGSDGATGGSWQGSYGSDGYLLAQGPSSVPAYAQVALAGQSGWTWADATADPRALQRPGTAGRLAACWYTGGSFTVDVGLTDGQSHRAALYLLDWDGRGRAERVEVLDAATGQVLDARTASGFAGGQYLAWTVRGHVLFRVTNLDGSVNAVAAGLFFGGADAPPASGSASFLGSDGATGGSWQGSYGSDGYLLAQGPSSVPAYAQVALAGQSGWTWADATADPRALQRPGTAGRLAACWYTGGSFTVDVGLTDGQSHRAALYLLDWDGRGRAERVEVLDAATGQVLDARTASGFAGGQYLAWTVRGHVLFRVTNLDGSVNAVAAGLFFG